jgi:hypothetical protein
MGESREPLSESRGEVSNFCDTEVLADFFGEMIVDLIVARYGGTSIFPGITPPGMISTFADQDATVFGQVAHKIAPLHTMIGSSM